MKHLIWYLLMLLPCAPAWARFCAHDQDWREIATGAWVWLPTVQADIDRINLGHVLATSVIVDRGEAMVIDPGPSHRHGQQVLDWIHCRWKARVKWVINTHAHAENVLGNSAFGPLQRAGRLHIGASLPTLDAMQRRCKACLLHLQETLGARPMRNTRIVLPDRILDEGALLLVGARQIQVRLMKSAHTESDTVLWAPSLSTAWAGGLVYADRIPELAQGSIEGWLQALRELEYLQPANLVGTSLSTSQLVQPPSSLTYTRTYLLGLRTVVLDALEAGRHASEAHEMNLPAYTAAAGYRARHGHNVQRAWREIETVWMNQPQTSAGN